MSIFCEPDRRDKVQDFAARLDKSITALIVIDVVLLGILVTAGLYAGFWR